MVGLNMPQGCAVAATASIPIGGGIIFGFVILLIIVAGFLVLNYRKNELQRDERDEDRDIGINKGIVKNKIDD